MTAADVNPSVSGESIVDVSVVIASFNTCDLLRECLRSVEASQGIVAPEIFVVDNDSKDGSAAMVRDEFSATHLMVNVENVGFAKANNRALAQCRGRYVLLLNPDARIEPDTLARMVERLDDDPEIGLAGVRLVREDGSIDAACRRGFPTPWNSLCKFLRLDRMFPKSRWFGGYNLTWRDPEDDYEVDSIVGAFMFFRRDLLLDVGPLDERFFMFGEDLDWCYRVRQRQWKVLYFGSEQVFHAKGASTRTVPVKMSYHFHRAMIIFYKKHLDRHYPFFVSWTVSAGVGILWGLKSLWIMIRRPFEVGAERRRDLEKSSSR